VGVDGDAAGLRAVDEDPRVGECDPRGGELGDKGTGLEGRRGWCGERSAGTGAVTGVGRSFDIDITRSVEGESVNGIVVNAAEESGPGNRAVRLELGDKPFERLADGDEVVAGG